MIYGVGTDLVQIKRIDAALQRHGKRFTDKILGSTEATVFQSRGGLNSLRGLRYVATRFAAKEAFSKALGLGMRPPMQWQAMEALCDAQGKPEVQVHGDLKDYLDKLGLRAQLSITDEADYALAFVILEKIK